MRPIRFIAIPSILLLLTLTAHFNTLLAQDDSKADEIASQVMERLGGVENWNNTRYIVWSIFGQNHIWDKWSGDFRVEHDSTVVHLNVNSKTGSVWVNEEELASGSEEILERAYGRWVNNSYWLVMPYKLQDPGTNLSYLGKKTIDQNGSMVDVEQVELTFDQVGLTPQNKYILSVDDDNKVIQWDFYSNTTDTEPRFALPWSDWKMYGNIMMSSGREYEEGGRFAVSNLAIPDAIPEGSFSSPKDTGLFDND